MRHDPGWRRHDNIRALLHCLPQLLRPENESLLKSTKPSLEEFDWLFAVIPFQKKSRAFL